VQVEAQVLFYGLPCWAVWRGAEAPLWLSLQQLRRIRSLVLGLLGEQRGVEVEVRV
jgi:hypothetical protein